MKDFKVEVPKGYEIDKENSTFECIKFKPISKSKITWNTNKQGVEVHSEDFHFIILDRPLCTTTWYNASYLAKLQGGYLPSKEELQVVMDNLEDIKTIWNCYSDKKFPPFTWSSSEVDSSYAWYATFDNGYFNGGYKDGYGYYVVPFCEV